MRRSSPAIAAVALAVFVGGLGMGTGCARGRRHESTAQRVRERINLGDRLLQAQNYPEAQRIFEEVTRLDPGNSEAHYYLGISRFYLKQFSDAERSLRESLRLNKHNADAHNALGLVYNQMGEKERALEEYRQALAEPLRHAPETIYLNLAVCLDGLGRTEEAISNLRLAVETEPKYYPAHWELAKILDRQDQTKDAIEEYEVAAPEYAADPNYHYRLGLAYFRDHRMDRAREHLSKVIAAIPGTEKAVKAKEYLELMAAEPARSPRGSEAPGARPR